MLATRVLTVPSTSVAVAQVLITLNVCYFLTCEVRIIELAVEECVDQGVGRCGKCSAQPSTRTCACARTHGASHSGVTG